MHKCKDTDFERSQQFPMKVLSHQVKGKSPLLGFINTNHGFYQGIQQPLLGAFIAELFKRIPHVQV